MNIQSKLQGFAMCLKIQPSFFENLGSIGHNNIAVIVQKENELKDLLGCVFFFLLFNDDYSWLC